jgi:tRNA (guanine-N(7)-)-methyltransferase subunit TRM82
MLFPATVDEAKNIDLYSALTALPKNLEAEHNAMDEEPLSEIASEKLAQLSNKELGRLKSKKAMLARAAALASKPEQSETSVEERDAKRKKADDAEQRIPQEPTTS